MILKHEARRATSWPVKMGVLVVALMVLPAAAERSDRGGGESAEADADVSSHVDDALVGTRYLLSDDQPSELTSTDQNVVFWDSKVVESEAPPERRHESKPGIEDRISRLEKLVEDLVAATRAKPAARRFGPYRGTPPSTVEQRSPDRIGKRATADDSMRVRGDAPSRYRPEPAPSPTKAGRTDGDHFDGKVIRPYRYERTRNRGQSTGHDRANTRAEVEALRQRVQELLEENRKLKARLGGAR